MLVEAFRPLELAFVNEALVAKHIHRLLDRARLLKLLLRSEMVVMDSKQAEVVLDQVDHRSDPAFAERRQPFAFGCSRISVAEFGSEHGRDRLQIVSGIKAFRNLADLFTECLAVTEVQ